MVTAQVRDAFQGEGGGRIPPPPIKKELQNTQHVPKPTFQRRNTGLQLGDVSVTPMYLISQCGIESPQGL